MTEVNREYLIIPDPKELGMAFESMKGKITRAASRGQVAAKFGDIGYSNANRILGGSPHLANHLQTFAGRIGAVAEERGLTPEELYLAGVKDVIELLATATTISQLPDLSEDGESDPELPEDPEEV